MGTARTRVIARLDRELTPIADDVVEVLQREVPAYRDLRGAQLDDVRAIAYWSLHRLLQLWATDLAAVDDRDRARFRAVGAARATDGRPLTDVLRAYRMASTVFVRHVADTYVDDLDRADLADLSIVVLVATDLVSEEIIDAYTATRERLVADVGQARAALLDELIAGRQNSPGALADRARELSVDLPADAVLLVAQPPPPAAGRVAVDRLVDALSAQSGPGSALPPRRVRLATYRDERVVLLLAPSLAPDIEAVCAAEGFRGCMVTRPVGGIGGAFRLAADALDTAPAHAFDERFVLDEGDAQVLALLTARPTANTDAVVSSVLGPLAAPVNAHILEGLSAFIIHGTATDAAARLHLHPQTMRYRLRRARELTGRDPRLTWNRLALDTALHLRRLQQNA